MKKRTKAVAISREVKGRVYERDGGRCILCGRRGAPNAHYISRAQNGLGIEQNIVTICLECHRKYDQSIERLSIGRIIEAYLRERYPGWDPENLIYRKD